MKPYATVSGKKIYDTAMESGVVISGQPHYKGPAETSDDATARVQKEFNSESLHTSLQKGILSGNGTWATVLCFGKQDLVSGVSELRLSRKRVDRYLCALPGLSRVSGGPVRSSAGF